MSLPPCPPLVIAAARREAHFHGEEPVGHHECKVVVVEVIHRVPLAVGQDLIAQTGPRPGARVGRGHELRHRAPLPRRRGALRPHHKSMRSSTSRSKTRRLCRD